MGEHNAGVPPDKRIEFRIGINLGDIIHDERDIFGDRVNVAARLEAWTSRRYSPSTTKAGGTKGG
jgi:class 3 adenylate cyclase